MLSELFVVLLTVFVVDGQRLQVVLHDRTPSKQIVVYQDVKTCYESLDKHAEVVQATFAEEGLFVQFTLGCVEHSKFKSLRSS